MNIRKKENICTESIPRVSPWYTRAGDWWFFESGVRATPVG